MSKSMSFKLFVTTHTVIRIATMVALGVTCIAMLKNHSTELAATHSHMLPSGAISQWPNPWRGLPGCLWLTSTKEARLWPVSAGDRYACALFEPTPLKIAQGLEVPPQMEAFLNDLQPLLAAPPQARPGLPTKDQAPSRAPATITVGGNPITHGHHLTTTINALQQPLAQSIVACMTGHIDECWKTNIPLNRWANHFEGAATRMATLVQVDLASGAIEVLASDHSACYEADATGNHEFESNAGCPHIAHAPRKKALWRLQNHSLYSQEKPGSLIKIVLALALLRSDLGEQILRNPQVFITALKESDTPKFFDWLYCKDQGYSLNCKRFQLLDQAVRDLGLTGESIPMLAANSEKLVGPLAAGGRMLQEIAPATGTVVRWQAMPLVATSPSLRSACAANHWSQCSGQELAAQAAEIWGSGSSAASPLSMAVAFARLGQASTKILAQAHLLSLHDTDRPRESSTNPIDPRHAKLILQGLIETNHGATISSKPGTAFGACLAVYGSQAKCNAITFIAGKTGTPGFSHDRLRIDDREILCAAKRAEATHFASKDWSPALRAELNRCASTPVKWYAAIFSSDARAGLPFDKAIVVLTERNWSKVTGKVDSALDKETPNIAAELGLRYIRAVRETRVQPKDAM